MITRPVRILGISGSSRPGSLNRSLLCAAEKLLPENATLELFDIAGLPLYCASKEAAFPDEARALKNAIERSDAILFAVPEHNFSVPAALKNAIDWGSRPMGANSWLSRPAAMFGATPSAMGTVRAQHHLRQMLVGLDMPVVNLPEVFISKARERLDADGNLDDADGQALIVRLLSNLAMLVRMRWGDS